MTSETQFLNKLMLGYQGIAQKWECDNMGHLNVSIILADHRIRHFSHATLWALIRRFTRQRPRHGRARRTLSVSSRGIIRRHDGRAQCRHRAARTHNGGLSGVSGRKRRVTSLVSNRNWIFDTKARRLIPWPETTREKAAKLTIDLPEHAAPLRVPAGGALGQVSREASLEEGFFRTGAGVNSWECDQFGHMNTMFYVRRQTEAGPHFGNCSDLTSRGSSLREMALPSAKCE